MGSSRRWVCFHGVKQCCRWFFYSTNLFSAECDQCASADIEKKIFFCFYIEASGLKYKKKISNPLGICGN